MTDASTDAGWLAALGWKREHPPRALAFLAHPDDETLGLGGRFAALPGLTLVHATDGAPRNLQDARARGFADAHAYAEARRRELEAAMSLVGLGPDALLSFGFADQEASHNLVALTRMFAALLARLRPDMVFTHAYEGGHPDHDAVAFAARAALRLEAGDAAPALIEMPFYHAENGKPVRQRFAPDDEAPVVWTLSPAARDLKQRMMACHVTQRETLDLFHADFESFRRARPCDFTAPPNGGEFFYETFGWNIAGADNVARARAALGELGLGPWL